MEGKTVLITGAASGMGRITARELAGHGARVIMLDRDTDDGLEAREQIVRETGNYDVEYVDCDVSDFSSVRRMAADILDRHPRLDVLINNAGITESVRRESVDGFEMTMATNFLAPFLICQLFLDRLRSDAPSRILNISSDAHKMVKTLDFDDIDNRAGWNGVNHNKGFQAYARSKFALAAVSFRLAQRLAGTGVSVYTISPGYFIRTNIHRNMRGIWKLGVRVLWPLLQSPYRAAETYSYLASDPTVGDDTGAYWEHRRHKTPAPGTLDPELQARIWDYAAESTGAG